MANRKPPQSIEVDCPDCGSIFNWLPHGTQKPRSPEQHKRFFLMCTLAYRNWPKDHRVKFIDKDDCRYWLTMKASPHYREVAARIAIPDGFDRRAAKLLVYEGFRAARTYEVPQVEGSEIVVYRAKSVSFLTMGHREFNALNTMVQEVIELEVKRGVDEMIAEHFRNKEGTHRERAPKYIEPVEF